MDSTSLTKPVDLQGLSLALAKTKADYEGKIDQLSSQVANADWNENDSTSATYIENRTHYTEDPVLTEIFTFQSDESNTYWEYIFSSEEQALLTDALVEGVAYSIIFNGVTYTGQLIYDDNPNNDDKYYVAGNYAIWDESKTDTGEPFVVSMSSSYATIITSEELANINLSVSLNTSTVHKLDSKYLNGSLITSGFGKHSEIFNWEGRYTYNSHTLNISGTAGATEYSYTSYDVPSYWGRINDFSFLTIESYEDHLISEITIGDSGGQITFNKTLDENNEINNLGIHILEPLKYAVGDFSHAEGQGVKAFGYASHAEGTQTAAIGECSHVEGYETNAFGMYSHAEGHYTTANGSYSHAEGYYTEANGSYSHAEGYYTEANGSYSHTEGYYTEANGSNSHAEGYYTHAGQSYSHAEGSGTVATGYSAHAEGGTLNTNSTYIRITGDAGTKTYHVNQILIKGMDASTTTKSLVNCRINNHRIVDQLIENNRITTITLDNTLSSTAISNRQYSLAGGNNFATGTSAHAEGSLTYASGSHSHSEGLSTVAAGSFQHVQGRYNIEDTSSIYADIVGNGWGPARSNAYTLDWNGNGWYAGKVSVGTVESPANPTAANDLATKAYVDAATADVSPYLSDLADTDISNPQVDQVLMFHERSGKWANMNLPNGFVATLSDTNISNPADGQVLQYDATSSKWVNTTLPTGVTETRVNELIAAALAQYGDGDTATYGYNDASEVNY